MAAMPQRFIGAIWACHHATASGLVKSTRPPSPFHHEAIMGEPSGVLTGTAAAAASAKLRDGPASMPSMSVVFTELMKGVSQKHGTNPRSCMRANMASASVN